MSIGSSTSAKRSSRRQLLAWGLVALPAILVSPVTSRDADIPLQQVIATDFGDWRDVHLVDGSVVTVAPRTTMTTRFDRNRRYIYFEGGDALFKVMKDPSHPFIVETARARATALGTTFAVSHDANRTLVTTTEGLVKVSRRPYEPEQTVVESVKVAANQQVTVDRWAPMKVRNVDPWIELAWTERQISFDRTWLPTAFDAFNLRNRTQISVPNYVHVLEYRVTGRFRLDDPEAFYEYVDGKLRKRVPLE